MWFDLWLNRKAASRQRQARRTRARCPSGRTPRAMLSLERLEDRSIPSVGPLPITGGVLVPNPLGGPDVHLNFPGPADSTVPGHGGVPSTITDFNGFIGDAQVTGTGTDNNGNSLLWRTDVRFMQGVYLGVDGNLHTGTFAEV